MKWKELKEYLESKGVNDDTVFSYEDMNFGGSDSPMHSTNFTFNSDDNELLVMSQRLQEIN